MERKINSFDDIGAHGVQDSGYVAHYNFGAMSAYAKKKNKRVQDLTQEERDSFFVGLEKQYSVV